ncbi:hypothetical protein EVAR_100214_1 [Eumeta japonica]|uniref:Uncharacterized protein n=1 Tax=Eumeta variegata TaxID=151549 RepID=A0A4C1ZM04_EUMVA|nr:hypothetical protein EVAR_100214_1 [Eumeta japonica]
MRANRGRRASLGAKTRRGSIACPMYAHTSINRWRDVLAKNSPRSYRRRPSDTPAPARPASRAGKTGGKCAGTRRPPARRRATEFIREPLYIHSRRSLNDFVARQARHRVVTRISLERALRVHAVVGARVRSWARPAVVLARGASGGAGRGRGRRWRFRHAPPPPPPNEYNSRTRRLRGLRRVGVLDLRFSELFVGSRRVWAALPTRTRHAHNGPDYIGATAGVLGITHMHFSTFPQWRCLRCRGNVKLAVYTKLKILRIGLDLASALVLHGDVNPAFAKCTTVGGCRSASLVEPPTTDARRVVSAPAGPSHATSSARATRESTGGYTSGPSTTQFIRAVRYVGCSNSSAGFLLPRLRQTIDTRSGADIAIGGGRTRFKSDIAFIRPAVFPRQLDADAAPPAPTPTHEGATS